MFRFARLRLAPSVAVVQKLLTIVPDEFVPIPVLARKIPDETMEDLDMGLKQFFNSRLDLFHLAEKAGVPQVKRSQNGAQELHKMQYQKTTPKPAAEATAGGEATASSTSSDPAAPSVINKATFKPTIAKVMGKAGIPQKPRLNVEVAKRLITAISKDSPCRLEEARARLSEEDLRKIDLFKTFSDCIVDSDLPISYDRSSDTVRLVSGHRLAAFGQEFVEMAKWADKENSYVTSGFPTHGVPIRELAKAKGMTPVQLVAHVDDNPSYFRMTLLPGARDKLKAAAENGDDVQNADGSFEDVELSEEVVEEEEPYGFIAVRAMYHDQKIHAEADRKFEEFKPGDYEAYRLARFLETTHFLPCKELGDTAAGAISHSPAHIAVSYQDMFEFNQRGDCIRFVVKRENLFDTMDEKTETELKEEYATLKKAVKQNLGFGKKKEQLIKIKMALLARQNRLGSPWWDPKVFAFAIFDVLPEGQPTPMNQVKSLLPERIQNESPFKIGSEFLSHHTDLFMLLEPRPAEIYVQRADEEKPELTDWSKASPAMLADELWELVKTKHRLKYDVAASTNFIEMWLGKTMRERVREISWPAIVAQKPDILKTVLIPGKDGLYIVFHGPLAREVLLSPDGEEDGYVGDPVHIKPESVRRAEQGKVQAQKNAWKNKGKFKNKDGGGKGGGGPWGGGGGKRDGGESSGWQQNQGGQPSPQYHQGGGGGGGGGPNTPRGSPPQHHHQQGGGGGGHHHRGQQQRGGGGYPQGQRGRGGQQNYQQGRGGSRGRY